MEANKNPAPKIALGCISPILSSLNHLLNLFKTKVTTIYTHNFPYHQKPAFPTFHLAFLQRLHLLRGEFLPSRASTHWGWRTVVWSKKWRRARRVIEWAAGWLSSLCWKNCRVYLSKEGSWLSITLAQVIHIYQIIHPRHYVECQALQNSGIALKDWLAYILQEEKGSLVR